MTPEETVKKLPSRLARALQATIHRTQAKEAKRMALEKKSPVLAASVAAPEESPSSYKVQDSGAGVNPIEVAPQNGEVKEIPKPSKKRGGPSNGPEKCPICEDEFRPISNHMLSAHGDASLGAGEMLKCSYCNKRMKEEQLAFHNLLRHKVPLPPHVQQVVDRRRVMKLEKKEGKEKTLALAEEARQKKKKDREAAKAREEEAKEMKKKEKEKMQALVEMTRALQEKKKEAKALKKGKEPMPVREVEMVDAEEASPEPTPPSTPTKPKKNGGVKKGPESIKKRHQAEKEGRSHLQALMEITDGQNLPMRGGENVRMGREVYLDNGEIIRPEDHAEAYGDLWVLYNLGRATSKFFTQHYDQFRELDRAFDSDRIQKIESQYQELKRKGLVGRWDK